MSAEPGSTFQSLPVPDADTAPFWEACAEGQLVFQRCAGCGTLRFPPAPVCHRCRSWEYAWEPQDGRGQVYSWVVVEHPIPPSIADEVPYVSALVELDCGVRMPARLVDVGADDMTAGMAVSVRFLHTAPGVALPVFAPDGHQAAPQAPPTGDR